MGHGGCGAKRHLLSGGSRESQDYRAFPEPASTIGSLRDEFPDEFPTDISEMEDEGKRLISHFSF